MARDRSPGCAAYVLSLAWLCFWIVAITLYIAFGPRNAPLGFALGLALVPLLYWTALRFPHLLLVANVRSPQSSALSAGLQEGIDISIDWKNTNRMLARVLGWIATAFFAGAALLFGAFMIALWLRNEHTIGLTAVSVLCGVSTSVTYLIWKSFAKARVP